MRSISERFDIANGVNSVKLFLNEGQKDNTEPSFSSDGIEGVTVRCRGSYRVSNASKSALLLDSMRRRDDLSLQVIARGKDKKPSPSFSEDVTSNWQMICVPFMELDAALIPMQRELCVKNSVKTVKPKCNFAYGNTVPSQGNFRHCTLEGVESRRIVERPRAMNLRDRLFAFVICDGNLGCGKKKGTVHGSNYRIHMKHSVEQYGYICWKVKHLMDLGFSGNIRCRETPYNKKGSIHNGKIYKSYEFYSNRDRILTDMYKMVYPENNEYKKLFSDSWVNKNTIDAFALALMWMDNGTLDYSEYRANLGGKLCMDCSEKEAHLLKDLISEIVHIETRVHRHTGKFNVMIPYYDFPKFLFYIKEHRCNSMVYKFATILGEDRRPIIPTSAEQLDEQLSLKLKMYSDPLGNRR